MTEYESYLARCPYYRAETTDTIRCEAPIEGALAATVKFKSGKTKSVWHEKKCCSDYSACPYAKALEDFWRGK